MQSPSPPHTLQEAGNPTANSRDDYTGREAENMFQITSSEMTTRRSYVIRPGVSATATRRRPWSSLAAAAATLALVAILGLGFGTASAQVTWTGTTADGNWATAGAFAGSGGGLTLANNFNQQLVFAGASQLSSTNTLTGGTAGSITFNAAGFVLSGNLVRLAGNITNNITSGTNTIGLNLNFNNATRTVTGTGGSTLLLSGNLSNGSLTMTRTGATGTSAFVLTGSNSLSGTTSSSSNTSLILGSSNALGTSVLRVVRGNLDVSGGPLTITNNLEFAGNGGNFTFVGTNDLSITGTTTVALNSSGLSVSAGTLTLKTVSGTLNTTKAGAGKLVITDAAVAGSTFNFNHSGGILEIRNASALGSGTVTLTSGTFQTSATMTIANPIVAAATVYVGDALGGANDFTLSGNIAGSGAVNKVGSNTVTLSGSNSYTGVTAVGAGVLVLNSVNALPGGIGSTGGTSNLALGWSGQPNDGVVGLTSGTFARNYGSNTNQVLMQYGGGFAAYGAGVAVNLGGASGTLPWGQSNFLNDPAAILVLGADSATHAIDFQNPLNLSTAATRTIKVNNGSSEVDAIMSGVISNPNSGGLTKTGLGTLALTAANTYSGTTSVNAGTLLVSGSIVNSSGVTVNSGATLGGSGRVSAITGAGLVSPGNSPGILTATSADLSSGLDFAFEFTQAGEPTWSSTTASGNDLLRLTNTTTPLVGTAGSSNVFNIYFASIGETYLGGLFTDKTSSFESTISGATFNYFVQDVSGTTLFSGTSYSALDAGQVTRSTVQVSSATFTGGTVNNGYTMQFVVVPEPQTLVLLGIGAAGIGWSIARRRRSA
jgi:autotransporter-associated beta strand protein